jgi:hypothetical protein
MHAATSEQAPRLQMQVLAAATWQLLPLVLPVLIENLRENVADYKVRPMATC